MNKADLELYTDYLISTFGLATATGLSSMVDGEVSHDHVTRFLSEREYTSKDLWSQVKSTVREVKRACVVTKNELMREMIAVCVNNHLKFKDVLMDSWFAATDNFDFIVKHKRHFIAALKNNRLVALSQDDRRQGRFMRIETLKLSDKQVVHGWLKGYAREVRQTWHVADK